MTAEQGRFIDYMLALLIYECRGLSRNNAQWNYLCVNLFNPVPGVYIKFEIHIPPFLIYIISPKEICYNVGVRAFSAIFIVEVNWGENMHNIYQLGEKYAFSSLFSSPINHFFPQHVNWPYFCQTEKYTPLV